MLVGWSRCFDAKITKPSADNLPSLVAFHECLVTSTTRRINTIDAELNYMGRGLNATICASEASEDEGHENCTLPRVRLIPMD